MEEKWYRNEYKHEISAKTKFILSQRLRKVLDHDEHVQGNSYYIKSLYFDSIYDDALKEKNDGDAVREKFRLRFYNNNDQFIRLEKKVKEYNSGYKMSTKVTKEEAEKIIKGDIAFLKNAGDPLMLEFYLKSKMKCIKPKVVIAYDREAFAYRPGNTRVTLDYHLQASSHIPDFFSPKPLMMKEAGTGCVLEVKFDRYLPKLVWNLVQVQETSSGSHSKYVIGRELTV